MPTKASTTVTVDEHLINFAEQAAIRIAATLVAQGDPHDLDHDQVVERAWRVAYHLARKRQEQLISIHNHFQIDWHGDKSGGREPSN